MESVENLMIHLFQKIVTILLELAFSKIIEFVDNIVKLTTIVSAISTHLIQMVLESA
jgi:hypothetical protein